MTSIRIWDLPTRLFHWALAICVTGLVVTGKVGGDAMVWHFRLGYAVFALLLFRLAWGLFGGLWSRFSSFVPTPSGLLRYLRGSTDEQAHAGHNPLGALSVLAMLLVLIAQVGSGLMSDDEIAFAGPLTRLVNGSTVQTATSYHKDLGQLLLLALVALHVLAIALYFFAKRKNLVMPMLTGDKPAEEVGPVAASVDTAGRRLLALTLMLLAAAVVRWVVGLGA